MAPRRNPLGDAETGGFGARRHGSSVNDAKTEGNETIALSLAPGAGYTLGASTRATATIGDSYAPGFPGVANIPDPAVPVGLTYLQATTSGGQLNISFAMVNRSWEQPWVEIYLNTDQNFATGDQRVHHVGGQEYRISVPLVLGPYGFSGDVYKLYQLPSTPGQTQLTLTPSIPGLGISAEQLVSSGTVKYQSGLYTLSIPLSQIGNPMGVDVFGYAHGFADGGHAQGQGDRVPQFGAIDSRVGQVVVRNPVPRDSPGSAIRRETPSAARTTSPARRSSRSPISSSRKSHSPGRLAPRSGPSPAS